MHLEGDPEIKELEFLHNNLISLVLEWLTDVEGEKLYHQSMRGERDPLVEENWKISVIKNEFWDQSSTWDHKIIRA